MGNRKQAEKHAIEASATHVEEPKSRPRRRRSIAALQNSWGGRDCDFYFRWAEAAIGFKAQAIEPQAETIGRRLTPFWDDLEALRSKAKRDPKLAALLAGIEATMGGAWAMPNKGRQPKVMTQPDKTTDSQLEAVKRYRRIDTGMKALKSATPIHFAVLHHVFLPHRTELEIEMRFGQLAALVIRLERVTAAHAKEKDAVTFETWMLRQIEAKRGLLDMALEEAEGMALDAIRAFEAVTAKPPAMAQAEREEASDIVFAAKKAQAKRASQRDITGDFVPEGWGR